MHIVLFDMPCDRLGTNIILYLAQILYAHNNKYQIRFRNNNKESYKYNTSVFVRLLFDYIDKYNEKDFIKNSNNNVKIAFENEGDYMLNIGFALQNIKTDYFSYFKKNIYYDITNDFLNIKNKYNHIPFDINKTILVHLRLDDTSNYFDYDGSTCSNYYKNKIKNNEKCHFYRENGNNLQAPLSKIKLEKIIKKAKEDFSDHKIILLTSPNSDTSFLNYDVIKNNDESYDLFLLSICKVTILSRSNFAIASLFFNDDKIKSYVPLWGHVVCMGLDTIYDENDKNKIAYFY